MMQIDLDRISTVIMNAWSKGTRETYGSGILHFHVFCDKQGIAEQQRTPASPVLIAAFISALAHSSVDPELCFQSAGMAHLAWHPLANESG